MLAGPALGECRHVSILYAHAKEFADEVHSARGEKARFCRNSRGCCIAPRDGPEGAAWRRRLEFIVSSALLLLPLWCCVQLSTKRLVCEWHLVNRSGARAASFLQKKVQLFSLFFQRFILFFFHGGAYCSRDSSFDAEKYQLSDNVWVCRGSISAIRRGGPTKLAGRKKHTFSIEMDAEFVLGLLLCAAVLGCSPLVSSVGALKDLICGFYPA